MLNWIIHVRSIRLITVLEDILAYLRICMYIIKGNGGNMGSFFLKLLLLHVYLGHSHPLVNLSDQHAHVHACICNACTCMHIYLHTHVHVCFSLISDRFGVLHFP